MHVYSDGGIDISRDGRHLVVCGMLLVPKPVEYIAAAESLRAHFRQSPNSSFSRVLSERQDPSSGSEPTPMLSAFRQSTNLQHASLQRVADIDESATAEDRTIFSSLVLPSIARAAAQQSLSFIPRFSRPFPLDNLPSSDSEPASLPQPPEAILRSQQSSSSSAMSYEDPALAAQSLIANLPPTPLTSRSFPIRQSSGVMLKEHICLFELIVDTSSACEVSSSTSSSPRGTTSIPTSASRNDDQDLADDEYTECHTISNQELMVNLLQCKPLTSSLMKAIVSTKFSPSGRYVVLGYGVRTSAKEVEDHVNKRVACEVVDTLSSGLESVAYFTHPEDEVNVSIFHPLPGLGLVYGTKTGKLRVFRRAFSAHQEEEDGDDEKNAWLDEDSGMEVDR
jgi:hypothetical protein